MAQSIQHDRYPKFVADQVLTEKSLNQMFGYLEEQQRLTRTTLIGIGVMCGMEVKVNDDGTAITITHGVGVTSKGYLIPFPETTYTLYDDTFSAEQEILYPPFVDGDGKQKFPLHLLHNNLAAEVQKKITPDFLEDKAVVIFVELLKVDNKNCDPDSCDDKGCTIEVTHRPLLVDIKNLDHLIYSNDKNPFLHEPVCVEWPEVKMPRYNVPSTYILNSATVLNNFLSILNDNFISDVEKTLTAAYQSIGYYIKDDFPNNPFSGLSNTFSFLHDGSINVGQLLFVQYYYDFFSDLILAYDELRTMCNNCLAICCPNEALFPRHLVLGNAIKSEDEFRHHWIQSPAFSCDCCSEGRIKFLLKKIALLIQKLDLPKNAFSDNKEPIKVKVTPSRYGNLPLSDKAIPYYYNVLNAPNKLYDNWNYKKSKFRKGNTNLSYYASKYNSQEHIAEPLKFDIEPYNFFRIEGHIGKQWKTAIAEIEAIKNQQRLPIDVIALNGDIIELIRTLYQNTNNLAEVIAGNQGLASEMRCYFADLETQYDAHAAELRCTITKVMTYLYNVPVPGADNIGSVTNIPQSDLIRRAFPDYMSKSGTYGALFDTFYANVKNQPYISPLAFVYSAFGNSPIGVEGSNFSFTNPIYLMYYLEKIHEALVDGLIDLKINDITKRIQDAYTVASYMLLVLDNQEGGLPAYYEESLDAVIRICKSEVFSVLYRNFLINYVLFISGQSFAVYASKNSGIQHKAGVTTGGTFIIVYNDKREITPNDIEANDNLAAEIAVESPNIEFTSNSDFVGMTGVRGFTHRMAAEGDNTVKDKSAKAFASFSEMKAREFNVGKGILDFKDSSSVRGIGLQPLFDLTSNQPESERLTNQDLKNLVNQFPDGTVIADFFVPNMCKASCMPMNFIVMNNQEEPPTDITLDIKTKEFCENDKTEYEITAEPEGGVLTIDGSAANSNIFIPAAINVGNNSFKDVVISYEINGEAETTKVRVFKMPTAKFVIDRIDHINKIVSFKNQTAFGDSFKWDFGDETTSTEKNPPPHQYPRATQSALVKLGVMNGPCRHISKEQQVVFETQEEEEKGCISIANLEELFKIMNEISTVEFRNSIKDYDTFKMLFIEKFPEIMKEIPQNQFVAILEIVPLELISETANTLNSIIKSDEKHRSLAIMLYEILLRLTMFYACIQRQDIDVAKVPTNALLALMLRNFKTWVGSAQNLNDEQKDIIKRMRVAAEKELANTLSDGTNKPKYEKALDGIIQTLSSIA